MTVSNTQAGVTRTADGLVTEFSFSFQADDASHVKVSEIVENLVLTPLAPGDYSVTLAPDGVGGKVLITPALASGKVIYIYRNTPRTQLVGVSSQQKYDPKVVGGVWDRLTFMIQELTAEVARATLAAPGQDPADFVASILANRDAAAASAALAQAWATKAQGVEVTPGQFSAYHWAQIALATALAGGPPLTRQIATDNAAGTDGGGDLSANRTIRLFGQALRLHQLAVNGFVTRVDATTLAARSIDGTANQINVANPAGAGGNPTLSLVFPDQPTAEAGVNTVSPMNALRTKQAVDARRGYSSTVLTTSGTSFLVSAIPAAIRELYVNFAGVGTNVTENLLIQLGTSAGLVTTGYDTGGSVGASGASSSVGFLIRRNTNGSFRGTMMLRRAGNSNTWFANYAGFVTGDVGSLGGGFVSLPGVLDRLALDRSGPGTFNNGSFYLEWVL